jgi:hypothetical protein
MRIDASLANERMVGCEFVVADHPDNAYRRRRRRKEPK